MATTIDVIVDLQFGSTGKGLLAGYIGVDNNYDVVISANMPNAGHTAYCPDTHQKFIHKALPSAIFGKGLRVLAIGPGAVFSIERLTEEWEAVCKYRGDLILLIHEAAGILRPEHKEAEQKTLSRISSTMQGSAEALISKIRREDKAIAKHWAMAIGETAGKFGDVRVVTQGEWLSMLGGANILCEGSQGYSLGISSGFYPYCTSRECTPARVLADCGVPAKKLRHVYGSCRVHPIRVGNTPDGYSGDWYPDQIEIHFSQLGVPDETTTVTGRVRRIATFSNHQILEALIMAQPDFVFLNFCNYDEDEAYLVSNSINALSSVIGCGGVELRGWGPKPGDIEVVW